jgi:hypothetical protein
MTLCTRKFLIEQLRALTIPMIMLCHEHDEDPVMRPEPISPEKREEVIVHMAAGQLGAIGTSERNGRSAPMPTRVNHDTTLARSDGTTLCPCGSGKKYNRRCGAAAGRRWTERCDFSHRSATTRSAIV